MLHEVHGGVSHPISPISPFGEIIHIAHNYAVWEKHFGKKVVIHRNKGGGHLRAIKGELGIITRLAGHKLL